MEGTGSSDPLARSAAVLQALRTELERRTSAAREPIAIVGLGCRFPGAAGPREFFDFLLEGGNAVSEVPADRWDAEALYDSDPLAPGRAYSRWGAFLEQPMRFDATFFGISAREAAAMDPQQRLLLEVTWEALEDAGLARRDLAGARGGVYMGICHSDHAHAHSRNLDAIDAYSATGGAFSIAANRISYLFDLRGPSMAVDTACSSSLTAVHLACQALRSSEADLAIAGGVNVILSPLLTVNFCKVGALARDGRCKFLDARADGYVRGEGAGVVILKTLSRARKDGDRIYACILGSAMTQDGRSSGLMAPSGPAQESVIRAACEQAGIAPHRLDYVEAHGTGTALGDVAEAHALGATVGRERQGAPCLVGSVKANIGHLEAAAGIAGLLKVSQMLHRGLVPRQQNFEHAHPEIPLAKLGLEVPRDSRSWPGPLAQARAGVSSFGFGGANVHLVLGAAPQPERATSAGMSESSGSEILVLSAHHPRALDALVTTYRESLDSSSHASLSALCAAAARHRSEHRERLALVAHDRRHLVRLLTGVAEGRLPDGVVRSRLSSERLRGPVFVFPGQGGAWWERGVELLAEPAFAEVLRAADALLAERIQISLQGALRSDAAARHFAAPELAQPALVACQIAMVALLRAHGVHPVAVIGHSLGEIAAAVCAEALTLAEGLEVAYRRGVCIARACDSGGMALVALGEAEVRDRLSTLRSPLEIAAVNGPESVALSGPRAALDAFVREMDGAGIYARRLEAVPFAAHSSALDPLIASFAKELPAIRPRRAAIPMFSTIDAKRLDGSELDARYWTENLRRTVRFGDAMRSAREVGYGSFLEVGPACPLWRDAARAAGPDALAVPSVRRDLPAREGVLRAVAALYTHGADVDWAALYSRCHVEVPLPRYPWLHQLHGAECTEPRARGPHPWLGPAQSLADPVDRWIHVGSVSPSTDPLLQGYRIHSLACIPAAAFLSMLEAVAIDRGLSHPLLIEDFSLEPTRSAVASAAWDIQVVVDALPEAVFRISVYGRATTEESWLLHASGSVHGARAESDLYSDAPESRAEISDRCVEEWSGASIYAAFEKRELSLSGRFRAVSSARSREGESLACVTLSSTSSRSTRRWQVHEIDACLQAVALALSSPGRQLLVPFSIEQIYLHAAPIDPLWSHATLVPAPPDALEVCADVCVRDAEDVLRAEFLGVHLRAVGSQQLALAARQARGLCEIHWKPQPTAAARPRGGSRRWIVIGPRSTLIDEISVAAAQRGDACSRTDPSALGALLRAQAPGVASSVLVVLPDASASAPDAATLGASISRTAQDFVETLRALVTSSASDVRMSLVSRGALRLPEDSRAPDPVHAAALALGRVAALEHPWLSCACVDLDPDGSPASMARDLLRTLASDTVEPELALRGGWSWVPRLRESTVRGAQPQAPVRSDATYLITGGLGGLGLEVAHWLVHRGARSLALVGRSEPGEIARQRVESLRELGAHVHIERLDVADREPLAALLDRIRTSAMPLRGVVHAAAVLETAPLCELDGRTLQRAMGPKVLGAMHLDELTRDVELDFFVLFSSMAALVGSPGLGAYSAANACLDALAAERATRSLPLLNIRWGRWADVGLAARQAAAARGGLAIPEPAMPAEVGLGHLERLLQSDAHAAIVLPDALLERGSLPALLRANPLFSDLPEGSHGSAHERPLIDRKYVAASSELEERIAAIWCEVLRLEQVGVRDEIWELGGDSIVGGQIVLRINRAFGTSLTLRQAFESFNVEALAGRVREQTAEGSEAAGRRGRASADERPAAT